MSETFELITDYYRFLGHGSDDAEVLGWAFISFEECRKALTTPATIEDSEVPHVKEIMTRCIILLSQILGTKDLGQIRLTMKRRGGFSQFKKALAVTKSSKLMDQGKGLGGKKTKMFAEWKARPFEVFLTGGAFYRSSNGRQRLMSTLGMESHGKANFGAFVISLEGRMYVFNHLDKTDRVAHSSFVRGAPVLTAGEIRISDGRLMVITTHSGHYRPDKKAMYGTLNYFKSKGVRLRGVTVLFVVDPQVRRLQPLPNEKLPFLFLSDLSTYKVMKELLNDELPRDVGACNPQVALQKRTLYQAGLVYAYAAADFVTAVKAEEDAEFLDWGL